MGKYESMRVEVDLDAAHRYARFAWFVLGYVLLVIAWGAYVRATGSGAGCGSHWPLCNGEIIPRTEQLETLIEFSHRLTSGLSLLLVVILFAWAFRIFPKGHLARTTALLSLILIVVEALLGAGLVLFGLVAENDSYSRAWVMALHLVNTYLLIASIVLSAWWSRRAVPQGLCFAGRPATIMLAVIAAQLILGASGAITALGDTLFPAESLLDGFNQEFSSGAHILLRLRIYHPFIAGAVALLVVLASASVAGRLKQREISGLAVLASVLILIQLMIGIANLLLLAPVWLQMVHLLFADLTWLASVILAGRVFESRG